LSGDLRQRSLAPGLLQRLSRQALHAAQLAFPHPVTGALREFTSPLPGDFADALSRLREPERRPHE